jgi:hypothetical protein
MNGKRALEGTFLGGCIYSARRAAKGIVEELGQVARAQGSSSMDVALPMDETS